MKQLNKFLEDKKFAIISPQDKLCENALMWLEYIQYKSLEAPVMKKQRDYYISKLRLHLDFLFTHFEEPTSIPTYLPLISIIYNLKHL